MDLILAIMVSYSAVILLSVAFGKFLKGTDDRIRKM